METQLIKTAEEYIQQEKYEDAFKVLNQILSEINPNSVDALNDLVVIHILENNYQNALEYLNKVLSLDPQNELALNNLLFIKQKFEEIKSELIGSPQSTQNISIIIPVFNKKELTINCLRSLSTIQTSVQFEVIIVDNASLDGTKEKIDELKQELKYELIYLRNETNLGFANANNLGVKNAQYNNILFLNNDTLANNDFISKPLEYLNDQKIGIVGIKLLYPDNLVQHAGIAFNHHKKPEHIFKFFKNEHPIVNRVEEMQAVTGACLFIKKNIFENLGGFDESFVNGWEDMDLCFKVRNFGLKVLYTGEVFIYHLESQSEGRLNYAKGNERIFFNRWFNRVENDIEKFYDKVRGVNSPYSFKRKYNLPHKINFAIKIGVPSRQDTGWGDIYYAESLSRAIIKSGHNCVIHYLNEWDQSDKQINVVIHIKGLSTYSIKEHNINVIWIINHPELHTVEELNRYDFVLCASQKYFTNIKDRLSVPCHYIPQATDENIFNDNASVETKDIDLLFVGNNYEFKNKRCRSIIDEIVKSGKDYNLHIIGKYWEGYVPTKYIKADFVEWTDLPSLYSKAKIVLNDHQETMRENGFINNRTFDLALMQAFQISNYVEGMNELNIVYYKTPDELIQKIDYFLDNENERKINAAEVKEKCKVYTFNQHASEIVKLLNEISSTKSIYTKCNICGYKGDDFLAMGSRQKVRCPVCSSLERQRALWLLLDRDNLIKPGMKVLEISPLNNKIYRQYFEEAGCEYVCIDKWKHGNPLDKRDTSWIDYEMDVCDLKFEDNTFDLVLMQHVIEEVPDDMKAFSEIARVTKLNGFALLEVPHNKNMRKTIEYSEPQKFGNLRQYGVDFYERIKEFFAYREEVIIDGISFSKLGKMEIECKLNFPIVLDHPSFDKESFSARFNNVISHFKRAGFVSLTSAQVNNLVHRNVFYKHPYWITLDDGSVEDIIKAYPILRENNLHASSFLISERIDKNALTKWKSIIGNPFLDIQNHSANHFQCFISSKLIDVYKGQQRYSNLMENLKEHGYPVFEYASCIKHKTFIPHQNIIEACLQFYKNNSDVDEEEYIKKLSQYLAEQFGNNIGAYESDSVYNGRIEIEINDSRKKLISQFGTDVFAYSFPWGLYSDEALQKSKENHLLAVCVNPKRINHNYNPFELERIELTGSASPLLINALYTTQPWEEYKYKDYPMIAVLMTTYNRQDLIAEAIQSVIDQTYKNWNLIVVNDGGEDISDIIRSFNDPRIKYYNIEHKGKAGALNYAINNSNSKYIAYLDDDDLYYPNHLEVLFSYLETHPENEFAYSIAIEVEKEFSQTGWKVKQNSIRYARQVNSGMLRFMNHIPNLCAVHSKKLFDKAGMYDETLNVLIDWDMYRRLAVYSEPVFVAVVTSEYSKRIYSTVQEKQITGLFFRDPLKYYENRLRILNKNYPLSDKFISHKNCVLILCNDSNFKSIKYMIYKIDMLRKHEQFEVAMICNVSYNLDTVELIIAAEGKNVFVYFNDKKESSERFINNKIKQNAWEKIAIIDDVAKFNLENIQYAFSGNGRVVNYAKILNSVYPLKKVDKQGKNKFADIRVAVIIPTYNNWGFTHRCLKALLERNINKTKYEIVIVDNNSTDETRKSIQPFLKKYTNLKLILNEQNYGFAIANNIGAKSTNADYLVFLNNDTEVSGDWLDKLISASMDMNVGIVGAKLLYPDKTIQHAGVAIADYKNQLVAYHLFQKEAKDYIPANVYRNYQAVTGACLLINKNVFDAVGGFDEGYINGYEDVDLCFKVAEKGYKIKYCPETEIFHYESKTTGRFDNVTENSKLLNYKWKNKINLDNLNELLVPVVSIVIPVFNQLEYTKNCLESIRMNTRIPYEVIVVNDGSTDGTVEYLKTQKDLIVITNGKNYGYPYSCNQGIRRSVNRHVVLLNNDTIATENWLENLLEVMEQNPKTGIVGPVSNKISGFQFDSQANYTSIPAMHFYAKSIHEKRKYSWMPSPRIAFICALINKELISILGGLDERFSPGNFEDDDFCLRAQLAGYKTIIAQDVFIHHYGSKSFKANGNEEYAKRLERNKQIFVDKWGADPDEIWLHGKQPKSRNLLIPVNQNIFTQSIKRALILHEDKDYKHGLEELSKAIKSFDKYEHENYDKFNFTDLLNLAGNTALLINETEFANDYFKKELEINPNSSRACTGLGEVFLKADLLENSKTMFEWALKNDPLNKEAFEKLILINDSIEKNSLDFSLSENINYKDLIEQAERLIENEHVDEAEQVLTELLKSNPFNTEALNNLAVIFIMKKENDRAVNVFERIFRIDPENEIAKENLIYLNSIMNDTNSIETNINSSNQ